MALRRRAVLIATLAIMLVVIEGVARTIDGYKLLSLRLVSTRSVPVEPLVRPDLRYVRDVPRASGVDLSWYEQSPPALPRFSVTRDMQARLDQYPADPIGAFLVWNPEYLKTRLCSGDRRGSLGILSDFYVFDPVEPDMYPIYRHLPNVSPPGWFVSNRFGWRGPDLTLEKPDNTVRIAFVGASTTISGYGLPFSHPEFVGHWLNLWAAARQLSIRFEVINAGRTGIDSNSIAAIVRQELLPVDPDLVIYYEGANQFAPGKTLKMPAVLPEPTVTFRKRTVAEDYSALVQRVLTAVTIFRGGEGGEPPKPPFPTVWPNDVDEHHPDVSKKQLPMDLQDVVTNLDSMRTALASIGGELAVSSFLWHVYPGMRLDLRRHLTLYRYLNETYWPASYAHLRRMADFQNAVFESYAQHAGIPFLDIARTFPRDADLFGDAVHMGEDGLRLQAWIYLQQIVPLIDQRLASHDWPRHAARLPAPRAFVGSPHLLSKNAILAQCRG